MVPRTETHERGGSLTTDLLRVRVEETCEALQDATQRLDQEVVHLVTLSAQDGAGIEIIGQGEQTLALKVRRR
ncbi:MAG: hypothetical protein FJY95_23065 [Candidatus Handelsmanbacteria bacterium]|nr:hypothetical protein [Candidatus Handelsmanbacteria bacterium]